MIAEGIQKLLDLRHGSILHDPTGRLYKTGDIQPLPSPESKPEPLAFHTLTGLVHYLSTEMDADGPEVEAVQVVDPENVRAISSIAGDFRQRFTLAVAVPFLPDTSFRYGVFQKIEDFIVSMQAHFVQDDVTQTIIEIIGNVVDEEEIVLEDDGFSQAVVARAGIAGRQRLSIPNPVTLRPYRTFPEVEQPDSSFVVRLKKDGGGPVAALFYAGDADWKREAVSRVATWLVDNGVVSLPILG